jgi:acid phosphatase class B
VYTNTLLDRFHLGNFASVEYTISADFDVLNKEIIKVLVTATRDRASIVVYARNNTLQDILTVSATVNDSYVDVILNPIIITGDAEASIVAQDYSGTKVIHTAQYFHNQNPLVL